MLRPRGLTQSGCPRRAACGAGAAPPPPHCFLFPLLFHALLFLFIFFLFLHRFSQRGAWEPIASPLPRFPAGALHLPALLPSLLPSLLFAAGGRPAPHPSSPSRIPPAPSPPRIPPAHPTSLQPAPHPSSPGAGPVLPAGASHWARKGLTGGDGPPPHGTAAELRLGWGAL